ncbi:MAG: hypothetical protein KDC34_09760 [Saprospiraceae bacterium]|nr:hypothetical protein [Saprospiraceae bacterium]
MGTLGEIIQQLGTLPFIGRMVIVFIVGGFMPLSAMTFFYYMLDKREHDFKKAINDMGMNASKKSVKDFHRASLYILPVSFITLICFLAITAIIFADQWSANISDSILLHGGDFGIANGSGPMNKSLVAVSFAFLGGFIWSSSNIIRRLINYDLSPYIYYSAGIRILMASLVSLIVAFILDSVVGQGLPAIAFLAGMFPDRFINYLVDKYKDIVGAQSDLEKELALSNIEGISLSHQERLGEVGIDNAQNLACYSLVQLLKKTPFETRQVLDWIGQAKLLISVRAQIDAYRNMGIRSAFDLFKGGKTKESFAASASSKGLDPIQAAYVFEQIVNDSGIQSLANFESEMNLPGSSATDNKAKA